MELSTFKNLKAVNPEDLLRKLAAKAEAAIASGQAAPRIGLTVGPHTFTGELLKVEEYKGESWVLLYHRDGIPLGADAVTYLPIRGVGSVTVGDFSESAGFTVAGKVPPAPNDKTPSKIGLARLPQEVQAKLNEMGWKDGSLGLQIKGQEEDREVRFRMQSVLESLPEVFRSLLEDKMGREAVQELKQVTLTVVAGNLTTGTREAKTMKIAVGRGAEMASILGVLKKIFAENL